MNVKQEWLIEVLRLEGFGFGGLRAGDLYPKDIAEALVADGLLVEKMMIECDGDGFTIFPEKESPAYSLTFTGRSIAVQIRDKQDADWQAVRARLEAEAASL